MAIAPDRCIGCERSQAEGSRVALAREMTMPERRPGGACGSLMSRPRLGLATLAAPFLAFVALAGPSLADDHQDVVGLGSSGASVTIARTTEGMCFIASSSRVTSISISPDWSPEGAVAGSGNRYRLRVDDQGTAPELDTPDRRAPSNNGRREDLQRALQFRRTVSTPSGPAVESAATLVRCRRE